MLIRRPPDIAPSEITPHSVYLNRRQFMAGSVHRRLAGQQKPLLRQRQAQ